MNRVEYIDSNINNFINQDTYQYWRQHASNMDETGPYSLAVASPYINYLNETKPFNYYLTYELYSNIYNMLIGAPFDTDGNDSQMYITNEDYMTPGIVDMHLYDVGTYLDEVGDFSMMLDGPPLLKDAIVAAIKSTIELNGGTVRSIDIKETNTSQIWGLPLSSNYAVRVFWHGSPLVAGLAALIVYAVVAALFIIGVSVSIWQIMKTQQTAQTTKQVSAVENINKALMDVYNNQNSTPAQKQQALDAITKSQIKVAETVGIAAKTANTSPFAGLSNIIMWVVIGLGTVLAFSAFKSASPRQG